MQNNLTAEEKEFFLGDETQKKLELSFKNPTAYVLLEFFKNNTGGADGVIIDFKALEKISGITRQTISYNIKNLIDLGFLRIIKVGTSNIYITNAFLDLDNKKTFNVKVILEWIRRIPMEKGNNNKNFKVETVEQYKVLKHINENFEENSVYLELANRNSIKIIDEFGYEGFFYFENNDIKLK